MFVRSVFEHRVSERKHIIRRRWYTSRSETYSKRRSFRSSTNVNWQIDIIDRKDSYHAIEIKIMIRHDNTNERCVNLLVNLKINTLQYGVRRIAGAFRRVLGGSLDSESVSFLDVKWRNYDSIKNGVETMVDEIAKLA